MKDFPKNALNDSKRAKWRAADEAPYIHIPDEGLLGRFGLFQDSTFTTLKTIFPLFYAHINNVQTINFKR